MLEGKQEELDLAKYHFNKQQPKKTRKQRDSLPFGPT